MFDPRRSVFAKLFGVLVITGVAVNVIVITAAGLVVRRDPSSQNVAALNFNRYFEYLARDIGLPPDQSRLEQIARDIGLDIRIEVGARSFVTDDWLPPISELREPSIERARRFGIPTGRFKRRLFARFERDGAQYAFFTPRGFAVEFHEEYLIPVLLLLSGIVAGCYLMIRRVLKPLVGLSLGVEKLSAGNLDVALEAHGADELANLARSFNSMAQRIKRMIVSKEQLLQDVSHELRSPLTRTKLALELMDDSKGKQAIAEDVREMESLVSSLLESARLDAAAGALDVTSLDLRALCAAVASNYRSRPPGVDGPAGTEPCMGLANADAAKTALRNVLENAAKYAANAPKPISIVVSVAGALVMIEITDYGPGLSSTELERAFEPFHRADQSRSKDTGGFGLGLSIARRAMRAQGGDLVLSGAAGTGLIATFSWRRAT